MEFLRKVGCKAHAVVCDPRLQLWLSGHLLYAGLDYLRSGSTAMAVTGFVLSGLTGWASLRRLQVTQ